MTVSLQELVKTKLKQENLSLRKAGKHANVAHTTIDRVLKGEQVDLVTIEKICAWLNIPVSKVLDIKREESTYKSDFPGLIALYPELGEVLVELAVEITQHNMDPTILSEIAGFISYRMQMYKDKRRKI